MLQRQGLLATMFLLVALRRHLFLLVYDNAEQAKPWLMRCSNVQSETTSAPEIPPPTPSKKGRKRSSATAASAESEGHEGSGSTWSKPDGGHSHSGPSVSHRVEFSSTSHPILPCASTYVGQANVVL